MQLKDMTHINWTKSSGSGVGSNGCYYKTKVKENGVTYYYKLSAYDSARGFYGHESFNEVIISRLCKILGFDCATYTLVYVKVKVNNKIYTTYACKSKSYKKSNYTSISFEDYYILNSRNESVLEFINIMNMQAFINRMLVVDYITINRDRHGANIEILKYRDKEAFAPLFDNGLTFVCSITNDLKDYKDRLHTFDIFEDKPVNNYIGQRSLLSNLDLISAVVPVHRLQKKHKNTIFHGMNNVFDKEYIDLIWKIITYRYAFLRKRNIIREVD